LLGNVVSGSVRAESTGSLGTMVDQAEGRPMEDPAKKRREYLLQKSGMVSRVWIYNCAVLGYGALSLCSGCLFTYCALGPSGFLRESFDPFAYLILASLFALIIVFGFLAWIAAKPSGLSSLDATSIPYVPPVNQQIAALPADAVLVRGSDEPPTSSDELLRAAREGADAEAAELLRAEPGGAAGEGPT
jgi:hypothetical protein